MAGFAEAGMVHLRLHQVYECRPVGPSKPLSDKKKEECRKLEEADLRPSAGAP